MFFKDQQRREGVKHFPVLYQLSYFSLETEDGTRTRDLWIRCSSTSIRCIQLSVTEIISILVSSPMSHERELLHM